TIVRPLRAEKLSYLLTPSVSPVSALRSNPEAWEQIVRALLVSRVARLNLEPLGIVTHTVPAVEEGAMTIETPQQAAQRELLRQLYVPVSDVAKKTSAIVFLICAFSLAVSFSTGFDLIHPLFSLLGGIAAVGFYIMGKMLSRSTVD